MHHITRMLGTSLVAFTMLLATQPAHAVVRHNESVNGDLSNNGNAPTPLGVFPVGTNSVIAGSQFSDVDDFSFTIPAGAFLSQVIPSSYVGGDPTSFIGIASGTTINHANAPGSLLGYAHFGPGAGDILDDMGNGFDAQGFTPPLGPGTYSVWMQQAGTLSTFQMDFVVTPEPSGIASLCVAALALTARRRSPGHRA